MKESKFHADRVRGQTRARSEALSRTGGRVVTQHLFESWPRVSRSIQSANHLALFLDFDGTLVGLRSRPIDVKPLDAPLRGLLRWLARRECLTLYVISGRTLADLRRLVPIRSVRLLGLHGWEGRDVPPLNEERQLLREARQLLRQHLGDVARILVEDKGLGLAVHYRGAPQSAVRLARTIVGRVLRNLGPQFHVVRGNKVWEFLPRRIRGKGTAVRALLSNQPKGTFPIFVGDDATDEFAFKILPRGLTIRVGNRPRTSARFILRNPEEVQMFLLKLKAAIL